MRLASSDSDAVGAAGAFRRTPGANVVLPIALEGDNDTGERCAASTDQPPERGSEAAMNHVASCQCGGLELEAAGDPDLVVACNCRACQRRTGAAFGVGVFFPKNAVTLSGDAHTWSRTADSGRQMTNHFCPTCGTTVYWTLEMRPAHIGIALGCLATKVAPPSRAIWVAEKHDWVSFPADCPQYRAAVPTA
jgi:hypothetical protein